MNILHDWPDEQAERILRAIRSSAPTGATLLVFETVVNDAPTLDLAKAIDIVMLAMTGGRERTISEHAQLLGRAGFTLKRLLATSGPFSMIEALVEAG